MLSNTKVDKFEGNSWPIPPPFGGFVLILQILNFELSMWSMMEMAMVVVIVVVVV